MPDRRSYEFACKRAADAANQEGELRAEGWRMTRMAGRQVLGRAAMRLAGTLQRIGWSLLRPIPTR